MRKLINYFIILLVVLIPGVILAAPTQPTAEEVIEPYAAQNGLTNESQDLYYVTTSSDAKYILVGQSIDEVDTYGAINGRAYITMPNGKYYIWAKDGSGNLSEPTTINVTKSCSNITGYDVTGTGTGERCFMVSSDKKETETTSSELVTCANNYFLDQVATTINHNDCGRKTFTGYNLSFRYCKKGYTYKCIKNSGEATANLKLSSLSVSTGSLTPNFSATNFTYATSTTSDNVNISATLQDPINSSFLSGYGPRNVKLNYGLNNVYIKTKNGSARLEYLIKITRSDTRSSNNKLSSLSVDKGELSPKFNANVINYNVKVSEDTEEINVGAELSDSGASFVSGFGPRKVNLNRGSNRVQVKVKAQGGSVRVYTINVVRGEETTPSGGGESGGDNPSPTPSGETSALLKDLKLSYGVITFDPNVFDYNVVVEYEVAGIDVTYEKQDESDIVDVSGGESLNVGDLNIITIKVATPTGSKVNTYSIYVERKEENISISSDSLLKDLTIKDHKIKFDAKQKNYEVTLKDGETILEIDAITNDDKANVVIEGNENLKNGDEIKIRVTAEDNSYTDYFIKVMAKKRGGNVFLTILVIILIIIVLAYLVLRAMGYKIVLNFEAIKDFFKKLFSKKD